MLVHSDDDEVIAFDVDVTSTSAQPRGNEQLASTLNAETLRESADDVAIAIATDVEENFHGRVFDVSRPVATPPREEAGAAASGFANLLKGVDLEAGCDNEKAPLKPTAVATQIARGSNVDFYDAAPSAQKVTQSDTTPAAKKNSRNSKKKPKSTRASKEFASDTEKNGSGEEDDLKDPEQVTTAAKTVRVETSDIDGGTVRGRLLRSASSRSRMSIPETRAEKEQANTGDDESNESKWTRMNEFYFGGCGISSLETFSEDEMQEAVYAYDDLFNNRVVEDEIIQMLPGILASINHTIDADEVRGTWKMLREDKEKILEAINGHFQKPHFRQGDVQGVGFSKIQIGGAGAIREVVLVPSGMQATPSYVKSVFGKKLLNIQPPNMVLQFDMGARHPSSLSNKLMRKLPAYADTVTSAEKSVREKKKRCQEGHDTCETEPGTLETDQAAENDVEAEVNGALLKIIRDNIDAVLQASFMADNWVLIDRRTGASSSPSAELLIEEFAATGKNGPRIVAFENIKRYSAFKPSFAVNRQLLVLMEIVRNSTAPNVIPSVTQCAATYDLESFNNWEEYHILKARGNLGHVDREGIKYKGNRSLPRQPETDMIQVDDVTGELVYDGLWPRISPENKWVYHYRQYFYSSASKIIMFQDSSKSDFPLKFKQGSDLPVAYVFAHGGNLTFNRLQKHLMAGLPTVLLYNTGGVTQTFGYLYKKCVLEKKQTENVAKDKKESVLGYLVSNAEVVSTEPWTKTFGITEVSKILALEQRAPSVMRKNIAFIDSMEQTVEQAVDKLTRCFASSTQGLPELGLGTACEDVVLDAWAKAIRLYENGEGLHAYADRFYYCGLLLSLMAIFLVIMADPNEEAFEQANKVTAIREIVKVLLFLLPVFSGILATVVSERHYLQKWANLHTTSWALTSEIYKFRCHVADYDESGVTTTSTEDESDEDSEDVGATQGEQGNARSRFVSRVNQLVNDAIERLGEEMVSPSFKQVNIQETSERDDLKEKIHSFVHNQLFPRAFVETTSQSEFTTAEDQLPLPRRTIFGKEEQPKKEAKNEMDDDDFISELVIEGYVGHRLNSILNRSRRITPPLVSRSKRIKLISVLLMASGTILVAFKLQTWVTLTVTLATIASNIAQYQSLTARINSHNNVVKDVEGLKHQLNGQSIVQRRTRAAVTQCVTVTEGCLLHTISAWTGVTFSAVTTKESDKKEDGK